MQNRIEICKPVAIFITSWLVRTLSSVAADKFVQNAQNYETIRNVAEGGGGVWEIDFFHGM